MQVVGLIWVEQHADHSPPAMRFDELGNHLGIGQGVHLGQRAPRGVNERRLQHRPDLRAWRRLCNLARDGCQRRWTAAGQAPVLVEDADQPIDVERDSGLQDVVVIAVAVMAPVHAADGGFPIDYQEFHVVDLMTAVVNGIDPLGHAQRV